MIRFNLFYPKRLLQLAIPIVLSSYVGTSGNCGSRALSSAQKADLERYKNTIQHEGDMSHIPYGMKEPRLYAAVREGNTEKVKIVLDKISQDKVDEKITYQDSNFPNSVDKRSGETVLLQAIRKKNAAIADLLINNEHFQPSFTIANKNKQDTPLRLAITNKLDSTAKLLIAQLNHDELTTPKSTQDPETPLHLAVKVQAHTIANYLIDKLKAKAEDLSSKDKNGKTALHIAVANKSTADIAEKLIPLQDPKSLYIKDSDKNTPLHIAIQRKFDTMATMLINRLIQAQATESFSIADAEQNTPLHIAIQRKLTNVARLLIKHIDGASLMLVNNDKNNKMTPLHIAVAQGEYEVVKDLVTKVAEYNCREKLITADKKGRNPLHIAAGSNDIASFECIWNEVSKLENPASYLMHQDYRDATVFGRAYIPKNKRCNASILSIDSVLNTHDNDDKMFHSILIRVKKQLTTEDWNTIKPKIKEEINHLAPSKNKPDDRNTKLRALVDKE